MLKEKIEKLVKESINKSLEAKELGELSSVPDTVPVDFTKNPEHGDRAISIAMKLAKEAKLAPRQIAEAIAAGLDEASFAKVDIAGPGFINLTLNWNLLEDAIANIHSQNTNYGRIAKEDRPDPSYSKIMVEYVSANPTGDLHLGHGRQAVLGSSMAELLKWSGYEVASEFYINDAGVQIRKLANSVRQMIFIEEGKLHPDKYDDEGNYPLDSMKEFITKDIYTKALGDDLSRIEELPLERFGDLGEQVFLDAQREILKEAKTEFEVWFSEKQLHQANEEGKSKVDLACEKLIANDKAYEAEDALWFKAKEYGDERDRVLKKADGYYTYLAGDMAYHQDKFARGFDRLINIWGADHHGQIPGMKAILDALGEDPEKLEVVLMQMVSLSKGGEEVKMSKRSGNIVTVRELIEEVGLDAFRYFLVESQANNRIVFDLELACKQDKDNPVYYIQYAHARCCSIIRNLLGKNVDQEALGDESKLAEAIMSEGELHSWLKSFQSNQDLYSSTLAKMDGEALASAKALILALAHFPEEIKDAALQRAPYKIANYIKSLAGLFHQFYTHNRVICDDKDLMKARVSLVEACRITLANALSVLGIHAPERM